MKNITVDFNKFIYSISLALDLAEACAFRDCTINVNFDVPIPDFNTYNHNFGTHSKRTAYLTNIIGKKMNLSAERMNDLFLASFLHDIGSVDAFSISHSDKNFMLNHSEYGAQIIKNMPIKNDISSFLRYHHENFDGTGPFGLKNWEIPLEAAIIHAADIFELMYKDEISYHHQKEHIIGFMKANKGKIFSPDVVDALCEVSSKERFWLDISNINFENSILERVQPVIKSTINLNDLEDIARVFASLIDKKSRFTHEHSMGVTRLSEKFAAYYCFDEVKSTMFKIAGYLHDLGKLSIPNSILDKPGTLTKDEFTVIKAHTYYTKLILNKIDGMEEVKEWAANHHETLRGTGYPEGIDGSQLSLESRIISVCDIYQALTEERPYRKGMSKEKALSIIASEVKAGNIDPSVAKSLEEIV